MDGIVNNYKEELKYLDYMIYRDTVDCNINGYWFVKFENWRFDIKTKINKLDSIISDVLPKIKDLDSENKFTSIIIEKKNVLKSLDIKYKTIEANYMKNDEFYRSLINTYRKAYENTFFDSSQKKKYIEIGIDIQELLKNEFLQFFQEYNKIRSTFIDINKYIFNIKKMFDLDD